MKYITSSLVLVAVLCTPLAGQQLDGPRVEGNSSSEGMSCVFLGHSFFAPIAREFEKHPTKCGIDEHSQFVVFHGGANGSPGRLWASDQDDVARAKELIGSGDVDLVGLTFFPEIGSETADYKRWVELGVKTNPDMKFFIMAPWPRYFGRSLEEYEAVWDEFHPVVDDIIDELREEFPETTIYCIPQGKWMIELWKLYEADKLKEVEVLARENRREDKTCLFTDSLGHGGRIPVQLGVLLWLTAIYDVDVREYELATGVETDLKQIAWQIIRDYEHKSTDE